MKALTKLQDETLRLVEDGKVTEHNTGYGSWRIFGAAPSVVGRLRSMALVTTVKVDDRTYRFILTEAAKSLSPVVDTNVSASNGSETP